MSDTPRTDEILVYHDYKEYDDDLADALVKHARQLEHELNACMALRQAEANGIAIHDRVADILSTVSDTPETDAFLTAENCRRDNPVAFDWLVGFARSLERKAANAYKGYQACSDDLIKCDAEVMRWFKAASPYATPGSLEGALKALASTLTDACVLIDGFKQGESWSEWDRDVRRRLGEALRTLS